MARNNKVIWSEGLFLRPQHMQQQERYLERYVELFPEDDFIRGLLLKVPQTDDSGQK